GVFVLAVVVLTIELDMLGPAEQVFQAEQHQPTLAGVVLDALGALAYAALFGRWRLQVVVLVLFGQPGGLWHAQVFGWIQPHRQRPGRYLAAWKLLDTARLTQRLTQRPFQRRLGSGKRIGIRPQLQVRLHQTLVTRAHGGEALENRLGPAL